MSVTFADVGLTGKVAVREGNGLIRSVQAMQCVLDSLVLIFVPPLSSGVRYLAAEDRSSVC